VEAIFKLENSTCGDTDLSARVVSVTLERASEYVDVSNTSDTWLKVHPTMRGWGLSVRGIAEDSTSNISGLLDWAKDHIITTSFGPGGSDAAGYTGSVVVQDYVTEALADGATMFSLFLAGTGEYVRA
jgi:hypothetical protein